MGAFEFAAPAFAAADFNNSGAVNAADLTLLRGGFGTTAGATKMQGDADGDHDVDGGDFLIWQRQVSAPVVPVAVAVPEPTGMALGAAAVARLLLLRRTWVAGKSRRR